MILVKFPVSAAEVTPQWLTARLRAECLSLLAGAGEP